MTTNFWLKSQQANGSSKDFNRYFNQTEYLMCGWVGFELPKVLRLVVLLYTSAISRLLLPQILNQSSHNPTSYVPQLTINPSINISIIFFADKNFFFSPRSENLLLALIRLLIRILHLNSYATESLMTWLLGWWRGLNLKFCHQLRRSHTGEGKRKRITQITELYLINEYWFLALKQTEFWMVFAWQTEWLWVR